MPKPDLADVLIFFVIVLLLCVVWIPAQQAAAISTSVTGGGYEPGSIAGRIVTDVDSIGSQPAEAPQGVKGVRVVLRSAGSASATIVGNQFSNAEGKYEFPNLAPGNYIIETDQISVPARFRLIGEPVSTITVEPAQRSYVDVRIAAERSIAGIVFIDKDGDGRFRVEKDAIVTGACITVNGSMAISDSTGAFFLRNLPAGRIGMLVTSPNGSERTHIVLDLGTGPVTNRSVNIPMLP